MSKVSMKLKLLIVALIPMFVISFILFFLMYYSEVVSLKLDVSKFRYLLLNERKAKIKDAVLISASSISKIVNEVDDREKTNRLIQELIGTTTFYEGEGYFFILDNELNYVAHGANNRLVGTSAAKSKDSSGNLYGKAMKVTASQGGGFVEYTYVKPNSIEPKPKISYVMNVQSTDFFIGAGLYVDDIDNAVLNYENQKNESLNVNMINWFVALVATMLITTFFIVLLSEKLTRPLRIILQKFQEISNGEGDLTFRIDSKGSDETALLADAFNRFISQLHTIMTDVSYNTAKVSVISEEINQQADAITLQLSNHNEETQLVARAVTEMSATAQRIAENSNKVSDSASLANKVALAGKELVQQSVTAVYSLEEHVNTTTEHMHSLQMQSLKINSVLQVIGEIAEKTNLLALNASIEAARAGEQGKGFVVVADEVRQLAYKTQGSTLEIKDMLDELHHFVELVALSMAKSNNICSEVSQLSDTVSTSLNRVSESIANINRMTTQIAVAATEQSCTSEDISGKLLVISDIAASLVSSNEVSNKFSNHLRDAGFELENLVKTFKI